MNIQELEKKIWDSFKQLGMLKIVTVVGTYNTETDTPDPSSKMMRTRLDILQGDKVTEIDEAFGNGPLAALRDYHAQAEASGHEIIKSNLATVANFLEVLGRLAKAGS